MGETMAYTDEIMILGKCSGEKIGKNKNSIEYSKAKKETAQQTRRYPCPCCGYYTYNVPSEEDCGYICPVCFWENDAFLSSENEASDSNHGISLKDARLNYSKYGACEKEMISYVRLPKNNEIK